MDGARGIKATSAGVLVLLLFSFSLSLIREKQREMPLTAGLRLIDQIVSSDLMATGTDMFSGVGVNRVRIGTTVGTTTLAALNSVYLEACPNEQIRISLRMEHIKPYILDGLALVGPTASPFRARLRVHPDEPVMSFPHDGVFIHIRMDRPRYTLYKLRYLRTLRFVLDAEDLGMAELEDFETELMV